MLLIPFVENSFKYSKIEDQMEARVEITLATNGGELSFHILNSHPNNGADSGSGLGIKNVKMIRRMKCHTILWLSRS